MQQPLKITEKDKGMQVTPLIQILAGERWGTHTIYFKKQTQEPSLHRQ